MPDSSHTAPPPRLPAALLHRAATPPQPGATSRATVALPQCGQAAVELVVLLPLVALLLALAYQALLAGQAA
ncbi:MAG TPA: hypothetical protein VE571_13155, partial [Solirubrobacteraceae bacterium]|nr:hypothetical protein [Solirubrobacteraceae bacterium]